MHKKRNAIFTLIGKLHDNNGQSANYPTNSPMTMNLLDSLRSKMLEQKRYTTGRMVFYKLAAVLSDLLKGSELFDQILIFPKGYIEDEDVLRLVVVSPDAAYSGPTPTNGSYQWPDELDSLAENDGYYFVNANRLVFLFADSTECAQLLERTRTLLAWQNIVVSINKHRIKVNKNELEQLNKEHQAANDEFLNSVSMCYRWLMTWDTTSGDRIVERAVVEKGCDLMHDIERTCLLNKIVIREMSPPEVESQLLPVIKEEIASIRKTEIGIQCLWDVSCMDSDLPRFRSFKCFLDILSTGLKSKLFSVGRRGRVIKNFEFDTVNLPIDKNLKIMPMTMPMESTSKPKKGPPEKRSRAKSSRSRRKK